VFGQRSTKLFMAWARDSFDTDSGNGVLVFRCD
jgi:hypothetical protein